MSKARVIRGHLASIAASCEEAREHADVRDNDSIDVLALEDVVAEVRDDLDALEKILNQLVVDRQRAAAVQQEDEAFSRDMDALQEEE